VPGCHLVSFEKAALRWACVHLICVYLTGVRRCSDALGPRENLHRRAYHGHVSHGRVLYRRHLMGVYLMAMHLIGVYLTGVHLMGAHLIGV
jgi:hypothetical protein